MLALGLKLSLRRLRTSCSSHVAPTCARRGAAAPVRGLRLSRAGREAALHPSVSLQSLVRGCPRLLRGVWAKGGDNPTFLWLLQEKQQLIREGTKAIIRWQLSSFEKVTFLWAMPGRKEASSVVMTLTTLSENARSVSFVTWKKRLSFPGLRLT